MFPTYISLTQWLEDNYNDIVGVGGKVILNRNQISFPNGSTLQLGFGTSDEDFIRYRGSRFSFVSGTDDPLYKILVSHE